MAAVQTYQRESTNSFRAITKPSSPRGGSSASSSLRSSPSILGSRTVTNQTSLPPTSLSARISSAWSRVKTYFSSSLVAKSFTRFAHYISKEAREARAVKSIFDAALKECGLSKLAIKEHFNSTSGDPKLSREQIKAQAVNYANERKTAAWQTVVNAVQTKFDELNKNASFQFLESDENLFLKYLERTINRNQSDTELTKQVAEAVKYLKNAIINIQNHQSTYGPYGVSKRDIYNRYCTQYGRDPSIHTILTKYFNAAEAKAINRSRGLRPTGNGKATGFAERRQSC